MRWRRVKFGVGRKEMKGSEKTKKKRDKRVEVGRSR
jgi:hypothetical protein